MKKKDLLINEEQAKKDRVRFIMDRASRMKRAKDLYAKKWGKYEKLWKFFVEEKQGEDVWRSALADTWAYATVKIAQAAHADLKVVPIVTRHEDDDLNKAQDLQDLYTDNAQSGDLDQEVGYSVLDAFKLGNGFFETLYVEDKRDVYNIDSFDPEEPDKVKYKKEEIKDFDAPKTIRRSPYLILLDEMATADFETARDYIRLEILPYGEAKRRYSSLIGGDAEWDEKVKKAGDIKNLIPVTSTVVAQTANTNKGDTRFENFQFFAPFELAEDTVEVIHYCSKNQGVEGTDTYEIIVSGEALKVDIKGKPSPIPYVHKRLPLTNIQYSIYSGDEAWAGGIIEATYTDAQNIRKNREMRTDRNKIALFSPVITDSNSEIDQKDLRLKPLSIIRSRGGKFTQLQIQGATNADFALEDRDADSLKRATGIDERVLGVTGEGRLTATEVTYLREASLKRLREFTVNRLYKGILREVRLKFQLFKQYYSSPLAQEEAIKGDKGVKTLKNKYRDFKVKTKNVYTKKEINPKFFEGDTDVDIDVKALMPEPPSELRAKWGQIMNVSIPLKQAGAINISLEKIYKKYLETWNVNYDSLREDQDAEAVIMAEGEHKLLANENTSDGLLKILPDGTPVIFLTSSHLKRHQELLDADDEIGKAELKNLVTHITKDTQNFQKQLKEQQTQSTPAVGTPIPPPATPVPQASPLSKLPTNLIQ